MAELPYPIRERQNRDESQERHADRGSEQIPATDEDRLFLDGVDLAADDPGTFFPRALRADPAGCVDDLRDTRAGRSNGASAELDRT